MEAGMSTKQNINDLTRVCRKYEFLVNDQRDAQILFYVFISIYNSLHVWSTSCSSSGETNCINTASGNSHVASRWSFTKSHYMMHGQQNVSIFVDGLPPSQPSVSSKVASSVVRNELK